VGLGGGWLTPSLVGVWGVHRVAACVGNGMLVAVVCLPVVCG
jgi:hypothetical protein